MKFIMYNNKRHQQIFEKAIIKKNENNYALLAVIYLFTSDNELWKVTKDHVKKNSIDFENIKLNAIYSKGYILYCVAKDLYLGARRVTISDITNRYLVDPKLYEVICNGMAIRRFGRNAWCWEKNK